MLSLLPLACGIVHPRLASQLEPDFEIRNVKGRDPSQLDGGRLQTLSAYDLEAVDAPGFYLFVETNEKHKDGGNTVYLTGPFPATATSRTDATGAVGHTTFFDSYNIGSKRDGGGTVSAVFAGEMLVKERALGGMKIMKIAAVSARSGHYKPEKEDEPRSQVVARYGPKSTSKAYCGFCKRGWKIEQVDFDLETGRCLRDGCDDGKGKGKVALMTDTSLLSKCSFKLGEVRGVFTKALSANKRMDLIGHFNKLERSPKKAERKRKPEAHGKPNSLSSKASTPAQTIPTIAEAWVKAYQSYRRLRAECAPTQAASKVAQAKLAELLHDLHHYLRNWQTVLARQNIIRIV